LNRTLDKGQHIALRVATGLEEKEFFGVVRSVDQKQGLISLEIGNKGAGDAAFFAGKEVTIIGRGPDVGLDLPCVVIDEDRFPVLVCRKADRRNYVRVSTFLHLNYRTFLVKMREEMGRGESSFESLAKELNQESRDPKLLYLLADLNRKLDRILAILTEEFDGQPREPIPVNISGSGLRFTVRERIEQRNLLAIRIVLPLSPPVPVVFLGEITRVREKGKKEFEIAVKYVAIDELDREQIVQYGFKRMRESIRNRKKNGVQT
jgi:c-di-GMP-binding flagellar brake protein YcgR